MHSARDCQPVCDILLLDVEMPVLDGISADRRVRKVDSEIHHQHGPVRHRRLLGPGRSYILKPINYDGFSPPF